MKCLVKAGLTAVLVVLTASMAFSEPLTLDDCIELALKNRASIIAARGEETLAKWGTRTALGAFLPRVNASYSHSKTKDADIKSDDLEPSAWGVFYDTAIFLNMDSSVADSFLVEYQSPVAYEVVQKMYGDQDRVGKSYGVDARMSLFDLANWFNYAGAKAGRAKAHLDVIASEQALIYSVKVSYYAYLATIENVAVQEQAVERSEEQLKLINSKFELGSASKSDVLKQKVQFGNDKLTLLSAQNAVTSTRAGLAYTIGINPASDVEFSTDYTIREFSGTLDEAITFGIEHEPGLLASHKSLDMARHSVRSRWSEYMPKLAGWASIGWSDGTRGDTVTFNFSSKSTTIGLQVTYNIFDGFWRERNLSTARVRQNTARAELADMRNRVSRDINTAYLDIKQLREKKNVARETVEAAGEDLKITQEKYSLGAATILDLLDAQVSLKEAQVSMISTDFDLNLAVAKLEHAMGKM
ncbi:MAG: TolC family protein [bacterium]